MWGTTRIAVVAAAVAIAGLGFAAPVVAAPCGGGMSSIEYGLDQIVPDAPAYFTPGAACSSDAECNDSDQKCEGGSCCVRSGATCSGLGYCCGHPSQGCVDGQCP